MPRTAQKNYIKIVVVITFYWIISMTSVFVNKTILSDSNINLDAPMFIVWFQCLVSLCLCWTSKYLSYVLGNSWFPEGSPMNWESVLTVLPLTALFSSMIIFNTFCLKHVGVAFYYISRSLTTVFNVALTRLILREKVSCYTIGCCVLIIFGFLLGVDQEGVTGELSPKGVFYGVIASLSLALYSIYTKKLLPKLGSSVWLLSYYNNFYCCAILPPIILLSGELDNIKTAFTPSDIKLPTLMVLGGLCGFSVGYVTTLQIKVTSPLTHNVSGTAKACAQTFLATVYYEETKTLLWWLSNFIVLGGSAAYAYIKHTEMMVHRV